MAIYIKNLVEYDKTMILATNLVKEDGNFNFILPSLVIITTNNYIYFFPKCCIQSLAHLS